MLKSLAYCGILLSGVGAIVLAMIHAQGESADELTHDITDCDCRTSALASIIENER
jgi:hypothetical protein